jgi:hypothetical protein
MTLNTYVYLTYLYPFISHLKENTLRLPHKAQLVNNARKIICFNYEKYETRKYIYIVLQQLIHVITTKLNQIIPQPTLTFSFIRFILNGCQDK